ncbi:aminoglycoside phosphotransferase family protein [Dictyobacter formicarum]|uniref:Spectinomycin phosphotransferase n=1 Tax=Dictyobacter formicarum TaxID=2778368 RepID=A0ABQ3VHW6_9CHLR|nr:aminoglycoside phosphotransferase family protein [Dictyobacter formicarum]GHO85775.1 spectinomycin phosphotransferase [Dictyobacter formicarum]
MREQPIIAEESLRACLQEQYGLSAVALTFLPLGLDYNAAVYRVVSEHGASYLLKITTRAFYEASYFVPRYLKEQGVAAVVAPIPTRSNALWALFGERTMVVYPFVEGDTSWSGMTEQNWKDVGATFRQIHQIMPPSSGFGLLRREAFDASAYARWLRTFEAQRLHLEGGQSASEHALLSCWMARQPTIHRALSVMEKLAGILQRQAGPYVICHADLHPANLIRDHTGHVFVIDWDEVMLAPKERDFLFAGEPSSSGSTGSDLPPFFQGYGPAHIDWTALTYYRYERVVQDLIECTENVFFKDDLEEASKAAEASLFQSVLAPGGEIEAAYAAEAHL